MLLAQWLKNPFPRLVNTVSEKVFVYHVEYFQLNLLTTSLLSEREGRLSLPRPHTALPGQEGRKLVCGGTHCIAIGVPGL